MYQPQTITGRDLLESGIPVFGANGYIGYYSNMNHENDQVTISARGENTGVPNYVKGPVWITGNSMVINVDNKDLDKYFLFSSLSRSSLKKYVTGGAQPQLTRDILMKVPIKIPTEREQKQIGVFLKSFDDTIALHQKQLENYQKLKKAMLQKMFPENGAEIPKIRFNNFTEKWKQRKLGEVSSKVTKKNKDRRYEETLTNSAELGIVPQSNFFDKEISNKSNIDGYYIVQPDNFVYNPRISNFAPVGPIKRNNLGRGGVMSPLYYVFSTNHIDNNYLEKYFDTTHWHRFMKLNGDSGARADRFAIRDSIFIEMPIPYPAMKEQEKIGEFLKTFDSTIALHQNKIKEMEKLKQACLSKMFI